MHIATPLTKDASIKHAFYPTCNELRQRKHNLEIANGETQRPEALYFPPSGIFFSPFPDDLSWQIGSSGCLASWPQTVCFLTSGSPSCWQNNATHQYNQTSLGLRIRGGNCKEDRRIREKSVQLLRENPASEREQMVHGNRANVFSTPPGTALGGISFEGLGWR